jgi:hypothetical protein
MDTRRQDIHHRWVEGIDNNHIDTVVASSDLGADFAAQTREVVTGEHANREATAELLDFEPRDLLEALFIAQTCYVEVQIARSQLAGSKADGLVVTASPQ